MFIFFLLLLFKLSICPVIAVSEFNIIQNISYSVNQSGIAVVNQEINLTNNISQIYAKEYQIKLSNTNIQNLKGNDQFGDIVNSVKTDSENTIIDLKFQNPTVGKDKTNRFFLNYTIPDFAVKKGNTWEIQFPVFNATSTDVKNNITLTIPNTFGELSFSSIKIDNTHQVNNNTQIQFNQSELTKKILLVFGNHQLFDFKLNYFIENHQTIDTATQIPLPPDTNNQTIIFSNLNPLPQKIIVDKDGNWLAVYVLKPLQNLDVMVNGQAKIHPPIPNLDSPDINEQTAVQQFWPTTDPQITTINQNLKTPKQIYKYVVDTLSYDYSQINFATRKGALLALANPNNSLCTEFTDLFVTLARSKGIPAREIEGFAYSNNSKIKPTNVNSDVLHAWPEYFDSIKKTWIQVDPTWEKTTNGIDYFSDLDLNHLAFVIHGKDSVNPPPPGSYKKDKMTKSVFVDFATNSLVPEFTPPSLVINGSKVIIHNPNLFTILPFSLKESNLNWQKDINPMPPLTTIELDLPQIPFWQQAMPKYQQFKFVIESGNSASPIYTNLTNKQHYFYLTFCLGAIVMILCLGGIILTTTHRPYEKNS